MIVFLLNEQIFQKILKNFVYFTERKKSLNKLIYWTIFFGEKKSKWVVHKWWEN